MKLFRLVRDEFLATLRRPRRLRRIFSGHEWARFLRFQRARLRAREEWDSAEGALKRRATSSYEDYVELQASKLEHIDLTGHEIRFRKALAERLADLPFLKRGATVLCLGARLGAEVRAFRDLGCFAVGVDLNPGPDNDAVLWGDFHDLAFGDTTVDIVYTNSLDHSLDLVRIVDEVRRILKPEGRFIIEADPGFEEGQRIPPDMWQTLSWPTVQALAQELEGLGLALDRRDPFGYPRAGTRLIFRLP